MYTCSVIHYIWSNALVHYFVVFFWWLEDLEETYMDIEMNVM